MKGIYFDYAATTPVALEVQKAMMPFLTEKFGNPGSLHSFGQEAMAAVDQARQIVAKAIGTEFREIIFTGSATEANNLAIRGVVKNYQRQSVIGINNQHKSAEIRTNPRPRIIVSAIEHESVLDTARDLEKDGVEVVYLPVNAAGQVDLAAFEKDLNERTILVSVMYANNEIGTIQPIREIVEIIRKWKLENKNSSGYPLVHTDAVQAFQFLPCDVEKLGVDLMTLSAHKIYGPKGAGALYVRNNELGIRNKGTDKNSIIHNSKFTIHPIITGGGQEFGLRSGTENVANIVGFSKAVELATRDRENETGKIGELREYFWQELKKIFPEAELNPHQPVGLSTNQPASAQSAFLPNIINIYFPGHKSENLLIKLDQTGIAVSSGSACSARASKPSHVLRALGLPMEMIMGSLRFSFGKFTTKKEIEKSIKTLKRVLVF